MGNAAGAATKTTQNTISPEMIETLGKALRHQQADELKAAEKLYKNALAASRHQPDVTALAAIFYQQIGRHKYCLTLLKKALQQNPNHPKTHQLLGKSHLALEQFREAIDHYSRASQLAPGQAETLAALGTCRLALGQTRDAESLLQSAFAAKAALSPADQSKLYNQLSDVLILNQKRNVAANLLQEALENNLADYDTLIRLILAQGESNRESLKHIINAYRTNPERDEAKTLFARYCEYGAPPAEVNDELESLIMACLQSPNVDHQSIALPWMKHVFETPDQTAMQLYKAETYQNFADLLDQKTGKAALTSSFFILGVKNIRADKPGIERLYTNLRTYYLHRSTSQSGLGETETALLSSLAQQCYLNEYSFEQTEAETNSVKQLKTEFEQSDNLSHVSPEKILCIACYLPLNQLVNASELKTNPHSAALKEVIETQIIAPEEERKYRDRIKTLGTIEDKTSLSVRQQYEENPYPRWKQESMLTPPHAKAIQPSCLRQKEILIAGCGTGKQIVSATNVYQNAKITAIDISRASLAYARRKLKQYEKDKLVELYHCDILEADKLGQSFDHIECCGVLHHMKDPAAGLNTLTSLLKTGGKFKIALYSKLARKSVWQARAFIAENGYEPTPDGIRACRQIFLDKFRHEQEHYPLPAWRDFYSLSECRDLIFHAQEICYSLDEIATLLEEAGLGFEKFSLPHAVIEDFQNIYPEPEQLQDLSCWARYEAANPNTFVGMYQFWAIKK